MKFLLTIAHAKIQESETVGFRSILTAWNCWGVFLKSEMQL